jgi:hypothetical protein
MKDSIGIATRMLVVAFLLFVCATARAQTSGSISGTVKDPSGSVIPDIAIILRNADTTVQQNAVTNADGFFAFTTVPVGHYDLETFRAGFKPYKRTGIVIDVNTKLEENIALEVGEQSEQVTVSDSAVQVETENTQVGEVVAADVIDSVALNGRSFTDLLALQPGIVPVSTQTPDSVVMAGVTTAILPSGQLNPGNQSISGQREDSNGFLVNGGDVKELMNGGTMIVPDLDSISEFRILTNNFDAEYGNYTGGIINVVTKSGTNKLHGEAFEFLRNTAFDARNYFSLQRDPYQQNQFGGTLGGPIVKDKVFFFTDYQGTRTVEGLSSGELTVPSLADRQGNLTDLESAFETGCAGPCTVSNCDVAPACLASQLSNSLTAATGHPVTVSPNEPYYVPGCTSYATCVFPNGQFPVAAWSSPAQHLLQYIPAPNVGPNTFEGDEPERVRDDKFSGRVDADAGRWGMLSAYYFFDDYYVNNPFPSGQGGSTVPGFPGLNIGRAQEINVSDAKTFGSNTVNEFHISFMRGYNIIGEPPVGPSLASQGFVTGAGTQGIFPLDPAIEGVENMVFPGSVIVGQPITNVAQANMNYVVADNFSRVIGTHTLKTGVELIFSNINVNPDATFNGTFEFFPGSTGSTGSAYSDFMTGAAQSYTQTDSMTYYPRHKYAGLFVQDSWKATPNLTLNYGVRYDLMQYWSEKYNQVPTFIPGEQSKVYPTAPVGLVYVTDPGVPSTLVPEGNKFAPRVGVAYSPSASTGFWGKLFGGPGKTSIRSGYGIFYAVIQGNSIGVDEPQPPYGFSDTIENPLFATPFTSNLGDPGINPYPIAFPPLNATVSHPNPNINFATYQGQAGMTAPVNWDTYPYTENYFLSLERQLPDNIVLDVSYVGSQAHHLPVVYANNPGNPAFCLALDQPGILVAGESCGPGGESIGYTLAAPLTFAGVTYPAGTNLQGTREGLGTFVNNFFGNDDYYASIGNSNYNSLQVNLKRLGRRFSFMVGYTYSKSIDQASSMAEDLDPYDFDATRAPSAFDLKHNFTATYTLTLPMEKLFHRNNRWTQGWQVTGITAVSTGFPVTLRNDGDNSLQGSIPNGVNNRSLDLLDLTGQPLNINTNPGNGQPYFNAGAFTQNALGTVGDASRRFFYGPGMFNTDLEVSKSIPVSESKSVELRGEAFNVFNHTQFFGPATVNGDISDGALFGQIVQANAPRLIQLAVKFLF